MRFALLVTLLPCLLAPVAPASGGEADAPAGTATSESGTEASAALPAGAARDEQQRDPGSVFFVQRNKNRNEVHYGIRLDSECRPVGTEPLYNYWLRLEKGPNVTEPVTLFQQVGYGLRNQRVTASGVDVVLRALPERLIHVVSARERDACRAVAFTRIAGTDARLERAYVFAEEGLLMPKVKYIELFGTTPDGTLVRERVATD